MVLGLPLGPDSSTGTLEVTTPRQASVGSWAKDGSPRSPVSQAPGVRPHMPDAQAPGQHPAFCPWPRC